MIRNSDRGWGWPAKLLHWVGALLILLLLGHGWWMTHLAPRPDRLAHYAGHAALGYDFMALLVVRLLWRWFNAAPALPADSKAWERMAAHSGHAALYVLMVVVTATGWMVATTFRTPIVMDVFGFSVPPLVTAVESATRQWIEESHKVLSYVLAAVVVVHIAGALRHHLVKRNDVLRRMGWST